MSGDMGIVQLQTVIQRDSVPDDWELDYNDVIANWTLIDTNEKLKLVKYAESPEDKCGLVVVMTSDTVVETIRIDVDEVIEYTAPSTDEFKVYGWYVHELNPDIWE